MKIIHYQSSNIDEKKWDIIRSLNQKIIPSSPYDQTLFNGGCLLSTCENAIQKAKEIETTEILLGFKNEQLISYMIFYCQSNPESLQTRLNNYIHLGRVGYSDMLVVDPGFQKKGYSQQMRTKMKQIARQANIDVFMTFVRCFPIPNIAILDGP